MNITLTRDEILDALVSSQTAPEDARTVQEIAEVTGLSLHRVRDALKVYQRLGRLGIHRVRRDDLSGRSQVLPGYTIAPAPKTPKRKRG